MIKRIKYGCFTLLFITTLTLSSIVAVLSATSGGVNNSFFLTYEPPIEVQLLSGQELNKVIKNATDYTTSNSTITSITFGDCSDENLAKVENATRCVSVASDGSDNALLYEVGIEIYILSSGKILAQDCSYMFYNCTGLTKLDLAGLNTSNVTNMSYMFHSCSGLTSLDLTGLDTSNVTNMSSMFNGCKGLTSLDLTPLDTANVTNVGSMFNGCKGLMSLDLTPLNTANVTNMTAMFAFCSGLTSLDLTPLDAAKVTIMSSMFYSCSALTTIYADDSWSTEKVTSSTSMFNSCSKLVGGNGTAYSSSYIDATYARIDTAETPGYFTLKTT